MKPKETQIYGLLITILLTLIILDLYTIYSITSYIKLTTLDVTTSFAVVDAIFYQVIKFIIVTYGIFALSVEIRGKYIQRERLRNKIQVKQKSMYEQCKESIDRTNQMIDNEFTLQDLVKEVKIQDESSKLNFEPIKTKDTYQDIHLDRYSREALDSLTRGAYLNLSVANLEARLESLKKLENWYKNTSASGVADKYIDYWKNVTSDIKYIKELIQAKDEF